MPTNNGYYSFLPYLRQGLASRLTNPDIYGGGTSPAGERSSFQLVLALQKTKVDGSPDTGTVTNTVAIKGPGDVVGINSAAIVKISPADGVTNFEPNYLPYIEFYDEDLPWRYTPAAVKNDGGTSEYKYRIRPWVALVVLKADEYQNVTPFNGILPAIVVTKAPKDIFPSQSQLWAWAHVHVNGNLAADDNPVGTQPSDMLNAVGRLKNLLNTDADKAVSRIIAPRRLEPNTGYTAFLIPVFEGGRLSGLGLENTANMLVPSWNDTTPAGTQYPVYRQWSFTTSSNGDFETLIRLLQPRIIDNTVGKRQMDLQKSNNPLLEQTAPPVPTLGLQGIVQPVTATADAWALNNNYSEKIREIVNAPAVIQGQVGGDPIIAPPIYGCWHAAKNQVADPGTGNADWIQQANMDPRFRIFAGAGTETLRRNQDKYMAIAWQQIGEVMKANQKLRLMQLTLQTSTALHEKHLQSLSGELLLNISAPVHPRIRNILSNRTVFKDVTDSAIPASMLSPAFRRLTRPGGPLINSLELTSGTAVSTAVMIADVNNGVVQPVTPVQPPAGQFTYNVWNTSQLTSGFTNSLPSNAGFTFTNPGIFSNPVPGPNNPSTQTFVNTVANLHDLIATLPGYTFSTNPVLQINDSRDNILDRTNPVFNTLELVRQSIQLTGISNTTIQLPDLNKVLAAPKIRIPMLEELAAISKDWIMPGLDTIGNNTISILQTNSQYLEAYMLGLNHAMAGELLWRGYPTDQRGTTFSFFWGYNNSMTALNTVPGSNNVIDLDAYRDIQDIHRWRVTPNNPSSALTALGNNNARLATIGQSKMLVLIVRGELLRKYPGTVIYMQPAKWQLNGSGNPDINKPRIINDSTNPVYPVFTSKVDPDIYMLGFAGVNAADVRGGGIQDTSKPGYFVIFQERAGEIRFGADEYDPAKSYSTNIATWDDVNWWNLVDDTGVYGFINTNRAMTVATAANIDSVRWNENAASLAYALHQSPVKLNVHAEGLIPA